MNISLAKKRSSKIALFSSVLLLILGILFLAAPKPASAGSSFSIAIGNGPVGFSYRSWHGGYRRWHPAYYDRRHAWHQGYWVGPVVYQPEYVYGGPVYVHHRHHGYWGRPGYGGGYGYGRRWRH